MSSIRWDPSGPLNIAADPSDLPENEGFSSAVTRAKNVRRNQAGRAITRDGSAKVNATAIQSNVWLVEEMGGYRYAFAGTAIYRNEVSIGTGVTSAQWAAFQYNSFGDTTQSIYALNGTDRKRIFGSTVTDWGIAPPSVIPTITAGAGGGLTGRYNAKYTYVRKVAGALVAESNASESANFAIDLVDGSLAVEVDEAPADSQITHVRLYRTLAGGDVYYLDSEIEVNNAFAYGHAHQWEEDDAYLSGEGYKFTVSDDTNNTENTHTWEETGLIQDNEATDPVNDGSVREEILREHGW